MLNILKNGCVNDEKVNFFGPFSSQPERFVFLPDDKQQISILTDHVKRTIKMKGLIHFAETPSISDFKPPNLQNLTQSFLGPVFGDQQQFSTNNIQQAEKNETFTFTDQIVPNFSFDSISPTHMLLSKLKATADQNIARKKAGYRFPNDLKSLAVYIRIMAGKLVYETIQKNLELSLPSLDSTNRYVRKMNDPVVEGCLRTNELLRYLNERQLDLVVLLSEDATSIEGRIQYDDKTNQISGFTLPINDETGMPIPLSYPARSGEEILDHFNNNNNTIARYLNVIMARPLARFPPFL